MNAGIYLIEPDVHELIPHQRRFDMTDLIAVLLDRGLPVATFPILEYWLDIGEPRDYAKAKSDAAAMNLRS